MQLTLQCYLINHIHCVATHLYDIVGDTGSDLRVYRNAARVVYFLSVTSRYRINSQIQASLLY